VNVEWAAVAHSAFTRRCGAVRAAFNIQHSAFNIMNIAGAMLNVE
jgi:hypothetical protein